MDKTIKDITICMGSSCFSRGNSINAELIERFLRERNLVAQVSMKGCLCEGRCKDGPNIRIKDELLHGVRPEMISDLLDHKLCREI